MKSDSLTIPALSDRSAKRSARRAGAIAVIAVLALGACTSDPSARRVAEDIIRAETEDDGGSDRRTCMLEALDGFSDEELESITNDLSNSSEERRAEGQAALDDFEAALDACN